MEYLGLNSDGSLTNECGSITLHSSFIDLIMPNTKSAARRVRSSATRQLRNHSVQSRLKTLEKKFLNLVVAANKGEATGALRMVSSALDKAVKTGVVHRATANRRKSRLSIRLNKLK